MLCGVGSSAPACTDAHLAGYRVRRSVDPPFRLQAVRVAGRKHENCRTATIAPLAYCFLGSSGHSNDDSPGPSVARIRPVVAFIERGESQQQFIDYLNAALRKRMSSYSGSAAPDGSGSFHVMTKGLFQYANLAVNLEWRLLRMRTASSPP